MSRAADWLVAERAWLDGAPLEEACAGLSERLGWILRAMAALDEGRPDDICAVVLAAEEAGHSDIAALAAVPDIAHSPRVQRAGPGGLRVADLVALLQKSVRGGKPRGTRALRDQRADRPVLDELLQGIAAPKSQIYLVKSLRELSPRAEAVMLGARLRKIGARDPEASVDLNCPEGRLDLSHERYPPSSVRAMPAGLSSWLNGKGRFKVQSVDRSQVLRWPAPQRRALLGRVLRRMHRQALRGQVLGIDDPLRFALVLAGSLPGLAELEAAMEGVRQRIAALERRDVDLLWQLWTWLGHRGAGDDVRLALARELMRCGPSDHYRADFKAALLFVIGHSRDSVERLRALELCAAVVSRPALEAALPQGRADAERCLLLAVHARSNTRWALALQDMPALLQHPQTRQPGFRLLLDTTGGLGRRPRKKRLERLVLAAWSAAAEVPLADGGLLLVLDLWWEAPSELADTMAQVIRRMALCPAGSPAQWATQLAAWAVLEDSAAEGDALRRLSRRLRRHRGAAVGDVFALEVLLELAIQDPGSGWELSDTALTAFVAREPGRALAAARELSFVGRFEEPLWEWWQDHSEVLGDGPAWRELLGCRDDLDGLGRPGPLPTASEVEGFRDSIRRTTADMTEEDITDKLRQTFEKLRRAGGL